MPIFDKLAEEATRGGLKFLVIGGHAVIGHGYMRATDDADILICKNDRAQWEVLVHRLDYIVEHDGGTFLQLKPAGGERWDLDLMLVNGETFQKLMAAAKPVEIDGTRVVLPSLEHLLALKLHALKHGPPRRQAKDQDDIVNLILVNEFNFRAESFRQMCEKHADLETYERIVRICAP